MKKIWFGPMFIAIALVFLLAAYLFNSMRTNGFAKEPASFVLPNLYGKLTKPSTGYNNLKSQTADPVLSDLEGSLPAIDDEGASDFANLQKDVDSL